jgi:phosphoglycerate dehydrogenase-like enzyme
MNILLHGAVAKRGTAYLRQRFGNELRIDETGAEPDPEAFAAAEVLITTGFDQTLPPAPKLRLVQLPASGLDQIDFAALPPGCKVCNAFEHDIGISEYVMAAMLQHCVDLPGRDARFRGGSWADTPQQGAAFRPELAGKTVGCIGYGTIGRAIAKRARAFGMRIMAVTRRPRLLDPEPDWIGGFGLVEALMEASDFVVVACPLTEETRSLIGPRYLAAMKTSGVLINVARGAIVDQDVLYEALKNRRIAGAVIDTWYSYPSAERPGTPPAAHPFQELNNVIMTPHCSGWTERLMARRFRIVIDNIERLQEDRALINQVHPQA